MLDINNYTLMPGLSNNKLRKNDFHFGCYRNTVYDNVEFRLYIDLDEHSLFYQVLDANFNGNGLYIPYYNRGYGKNQVVSVIDKKIEYIMQSMVNKKIIKKVKEEEDAVLTDTLIKIKYFEDIDHIKSISIGNWIDLRAAEDVNLKKGEFKLISLGIGMKLPDGYEALVAPRSSTYKNFKIIQANSIGIIDSSYCGDTDVWKFPAIAMQDTTIHKNDRICQFRIIRSQPEIAFETVKQLDTKSRGGFGSTGKN